MKTKTTLILLILGSLFNSSCSKDEVLNPINNKITLNNLTYKIKHSEYYDFGHHWDRGYHNMEFYLGDISKNVWVNCNDCSGTFLVLDIYNEKPIVPTDYLYRIEKKASNQISCKMFIRGEKGVEGRVDLVSGTVEIIGEDLNNIRIEIDAIGDLGQEIHVKFKGSLSLASD